MSKLAIVFGVLLILLSLGTYFAGEVGHRSPTAFIPAIEGVLLLIFGAIALKPNLRMHAMHGAAVIGLLGLIAAIGGLIARRPHGLALVGMLGMAILSLLFILLCIRSFIVARRGRIASAGDVT